MGTILENADNFKKQGNEAFAQRTKEGYKNAQAFYTKGLEQNPEDVALHGTLYVNRALVHLKLGNHGWAVKDCLSALALVDRHDDENSSTNATERAQTPSDLFVLKAFLRLAEGLRHLERFAEAKKALETGLRYDPAHDVLQQELKKTIQLMEADEQKKAALAESTRQETASRTRLTQLIKVAFLLFKPHNTVAQG